MTRPPGTRPGSMRSRPTQAHAHAQDSSVKRAAAGMHEWLLIRYQRRAEVHCPCGPPHDRGGREGLTLTTYKLRRVLLRIRSPAAMESKKSNRNALHYFSTLFRLP